MATPKKHRGEGTRGFTLGSSALFSESDRDALGGPFEGDARAPVSSPWFSPSSQWRPSPPASCLSRVSPTLSARSVSRLGRAAASPRASVERDVEARAPRRVRAFVTSAVHGTAPAPVHSDDREEGVQFFLACDDEGEAPLACLARPPAQPAGGSEGAASVTPRPPLASTSPQPFDGPSPFAAAAPPFAPPSAPPPSFSSFPSAPSPSPAAGAFNQTQEASPAPAAYSAYPGSPPEASGAAFACRSRDGADSAEAPAATSGRGESAGQLFVNGGLATSHRVSPASTSVAFPAAPAPEGETKADGAGGRLIYTPNGDALSKARGGETRSGGGERPSPVPHHTPHASQGADNRHAFSFPASSGIASTAPGPPRMSPGLAGASGPSSSSSSAPGSFASFPSAAQGPTFVLAAPTEAWRAPEGAATCAPEGRQIQPSASSFAASTLAASPFPPSSADALTAGASVASAAHASPPGCPQPPLAGGCGAQAGRSLESSAAQRRATPLPPSFQRSPPPSQFPPPAEAQPAPRPAPAADKRPAEGDAAGRGQAIHSALPSSHSGGSLPASSPFPSGAPLSRQASLPQAVSQGALGPASDPSAGAVFARPSFASGPAVFSAAGGSEQASSRAFTLPSPDSKKGCEAGTLKPGSHGPFGGAAKPGAKAAAKPSFAGALPARPPPAAPAQGAISALSSGAHVISHAAALPIAKGYHPPVPPTVWHPHKPVGDSHASPSAGGGKKVAFAAAAGAAHAAGLSGATGGAGASRLPSHVSHGAEGGERAGAGLEFLLPFSRRAPPRTPDEAIVAHAATLAMAAEKQTLASPLSGLFPRALSPTSLGPGERPMGAGEGDEDEEGAKARVAAFETELPPIEFLPSIPRLLHVFDYVGTSLLQKTLQDDAGLPPKPCSTERVSKLGGAGDESGEKGGPARPAPSGAAGENKAAEAAANAAKCAASKSSATATAASACCALPPPFPPPVSSLLAPPQPPVGGLAGGPFPPSTAVAPLALLAAAVDPGCLLEGPVAGRHPSSDACEGRLHLHALLQPRGSRCAGIAREERAREFVDCVPSRFAAPLGGDGERASAHPGDAAGPSPEAVEGCGCEEAEFWVAARFLIPPERSLAVVNLDLKRACGAALFEQIRRKIEADAAAADAAEPKSASAVGSVLPPSSGACNAGKLSSGERGGGGASKCEPHGEEDSAKTPSGRDGLDAEGAKHPEDAAAGADETPVNGAAASEPSTVGAVPPDASSSAASSLSLKAGRKANRPRPEIPPPEDVLWNIVDWQDAVDALCVAWLADSGLPPTLILPSVPAAASHADASLPSHERYLRRQPATCLASTDKRWWTSTPAPGKASDNGAGSAPSAAEAEPAPLDGTTGKQEEEGSQAASSPASATVARPSKRTGKESEDAEEESERLDDAPRFVWLVAVAKLLAADVRRQLARAAEREIDFTCLAQMAAALEREDRERRQCARLQRARAPSETGVAASVGVAREGEREASAILNRTRQGSGTEAREVEHRVAGSSNATLAALGGKGSCTPSAAATESPHAAESLSSSLASPSSSSASSSSTSPWSASVSSLSASSSPPPAAVAGEGASSASAFGAFSPSPSLPSTGSAAFSSPCVHARSTPPTKPVPQSSLASCGLSAAASLPASAAAFSVSLSSLLSAFACTIEIDVQDGPSETRIDDRFRWDLRHGDDSILAYCQQLALDCSLSAPLVALYRLAFHRSLERHKRELVSEYKPQLRRFHWARGLAPPLAALSGKSLSSGAAAPTDLRCGDRHPREDGAGEGLRGLPRVPCGGGRLFYKPNRDLCGEGASGLASSQSASLLLPWSASLVSFRRTQPAAPRSLLLPSAPAARLPPSSLQGPRRALVASSAVAPHTALERLPDPYLGAPLAVPDAGPSDPSSGATGAAAACGLSREGGGGGGSASAESGSAVSSGECSGERELLRRAAWLQSFAERDADRHGDAGDLHASHAGEFGPHILRGAEAAAWPGRRGWHKRRRR
ncbi:hypothetical protein BESB_060250 [Besnoitia besnoiti]|uniref:Uncharacterized protein n=1 Tax=Besnoitia besnoiti TaxID=94643 RepID=A0A2A9M9I3_BESBE|nr:hypothetical protein BESB_060250 [Besnoitia besnoiti]PFH35138.1 hypothetical protein BESB_060250 [Besnoitia besnoiti]